MSSSVDYIESEDDESNGGRRSLRAATLDKLVQFCIDEFGMFFLNNLIDHYSDSDLCNLWNLIWKGKDICKVTCF